MDNLSGVNNPGDSRLGPLPAPRTARRPPLPASRAAVLAALRAATEPIALATLIPATGLHVNTLREHLAALEDAELVRRRRAPPSGRGRPAWLYEAIGGPQEQEQGAAPYAGLATALASAISRTSDSPRQDAIRAGTEWGHELARNQPLSPAAPDPRRQVTTLLAGIGFGPEAAAEQSLRLTRCPLLDAARQYPDVVCGVHLGIVRGALEEYGTDPTGVDLFPFSEPGACRLLLAGAPQEQR